MPHGPRPTPSLRGFALRLVVSVGIGAGFCFLAFRDLRLSDLGEAFAKADYFWIAPFVVTLLAAQILRSWRWHYLLAPLMSSPPGLWRLLTISAVGFAAIVFLPLRLGELVRPYLIADPRDSTDTKAHTGLHGGRLRMSAALGTIAVERVVDGLLISLFLCGSFLSLRDTPEAPTWLLPTAFSALGIFIGATVFLVVGLWKPRWAISVALTITLVAPLARRLGGRMKALENRLADLLEGTISGFRALAVKSALGPFIGMSLFYWALNGLGYYVLAQAFHLDLSLLAAFALCGMIAIGILLPSGPGLVGNFHEFGRFGLQVSLPAAVIAGPGMAFIVLTHGLHLLWHLATGLAALGSVHVRLGRALSATSSSPKEPPESAI